MAERRRRGVDGPREGRYPISTGEAELERDRLDPDLWTVWVNGMPSSPVHIRDATILDFEYLRWMADVLDVAGAAPAPAPVDAVHLGGGACALPRMVEVVRPGSRQVVVELDGELARLVRTWFDLPRSPRLRIQPGDAREGLARRPTASADLVVRDVFSGEVTPRHVTTSEFLVDVVRVLRADGLYLANVADRAGMAGLRSEVGTLQEAFAHTALLAEPGALRKRRYANAVLVGCAEPLPVAALVRRLGTSSVPARVVHGEALTAFVGGAPPLTDP